MLHHANKSTAPTCAGCNSPANCTVWEFPLCFECQTAWHRDDSFSSGAINRALGISDKPEDYTPANHARYCAEATKRTKTWLASRKTARAA